MKSRERKRGSCLVIMEGLGVEGSLDSFSSLSSTSSKSKSESEALQNLYEQDSEKKRRISGDLSHEVLETSRSGSSVSLIFKTETRESLPAPSESEEKTAPCCSIL